MDASVIVADDDDDIAALVRSLAERAGWSDVRSATSGQDALAAFRSAHADGPVDAAVLDVRMPDMTGLEVARAILAESPATTVILYSTMLDEAMTISARHMGVTACISKQQLMDLPQMLLHWIPNGGTA